MTHSPVRMMFLAVCDTASNPTVRRQPSQNTDEIGARLHDPGFKVLLRITGVPRYRIAGSTVLWVDVMGRPIPLCRLSEQSFISSALETDLLGQLARDAPFSAVELGKFWAR